MSSMTTLAKVHAMLPGSLLLNISAQDAERLMLSRVGTDSRQIDAGELFIALAGERFDAHDFLVDVANSGAGAALVSDAKKCPEMMKSGHFWAPLAPRGHPPTFPPLSGGLCHLQGGGTGAPNPPPCGGVQKL